jgi:O-antigen ligase
MSNDRIAATRSWANGGLAAGLLVLAAGVMLFFAWRIFDAFSVPKEALLKIGTLVLGAGVIWRWWRDGMVRWPWGPIIVAVAAMWGWGWVSLAVTPYPIWTVRLQWFLLHLFLAVFMVPVILNHERQLWWFWKGIALVGALVALIAVGQYFGLDYEQGIRFVRLAEPPLKTEIYSTIGNANYLAAVLAFLLPIAMAAAIDRQSRARAALWWGCVVLLAAALIMTRSKGGLLAGIAGGALFWWLHGMWRRRPIGSVIAGSAGWLIGMLAAVLIGGWLVTATFFGPEAARTPSLMEDWKKLSSLSWDDPSVKGRLLMWQTTLEMVADHPITGIGAGTYGAQYQSYRARVFERLPDPAAVYPASEHSYDEAGHAHSDYLQLLAETGLVGLGLFLGLIALCYVTGLKILRAHDPSLATGPWPLAPLLCGILAALAALLTYAMVDFPLNQPVAGLLFWLGIGTIVAMDAQREPSGGRWRHRLLQRPVPWMAGRLAGGVLGVGLLFLVGLGAVHAIRPVMASAYQRDGWRLMIEQRWAAALPVIEEGLAWEPWQPELTLYLGVAHYQLGHLGLSRAAYRRYQLLYSDYQTLYNLGLIAVRERQFTAAEGYFRQALRFKPTLAEAAALLAVVAEQTGRPDEAQDYRRHAARLRAVGR